jgi:hypothetical protein
MSVNSSSIRGQLRERLLRPRRCNDFVTQILEQGGKNFEQVRLVIDHKDNARHNTLDTEFLRYPRFVSSARATPCGQLHNNDAVPSNVQITRAQSACRAPPSVAEEGGAAYCGPVPSRQGCFLLICEKN